MAKPVSRCQKTAANMRDHAASVRLGRAAGLVTWIALALVPGCRSVDNAQVDLLERELRQQEDYIYELEDYLMEYSEKLRQCRMSCQSEPVIMQAPTASKSKSALREPELIEEPPRRRPSSSRGGRSTLRSPHSESPAATATGEQPEASPERESEPMPEPEPASPQDMEAPDVEIGEPGAALPWRQAEPVASAPPADASAATDVEVAPDGDQAPPFIPDPADYQVDAEAPRQVAVQDELDAETAAQETPESAQKPSRRPRLPRKPGLCCRRSRIPRGRSPRVWRFAACLLGRRPRRTPSPAACSLSSRRSMPWMNPSMPTARLRSWS